MFLFGEICPTWRCEFVPWYTRRVHWLIKAQAHGVLPTHASERRQRTRERAQRAAEQSAGVTGQKSAEAVVAAPPQDERGKGPNTNGQGGAVTDSTSTTNPTGGAEARRASRSQPCTMI